MEKNLFDNESIDINEIAGSTEAIIEGGSKPTPKKEEKKVDKKEEEEEFEEEKDENSIDLNELKNENSSLNDDTDEGTGVKKPGTPAKKDEKSPSSQSALASLALVLQEAGVLPSLTEEEISKIENSDALVNAIATQLKQNEFADLDDEQKAYIQALRSGVPHYQYAEKKSNAQAYKNITEEAIEENDNLQLELIKRNFLIKGIDAETATKLATNIASSDESIEEAIKAKNALIKYEEDNLKEEIKKAKETADKKLKDEQDRIDSLKSKVNENTEVLPGIKVNSVTKEKIFTSMVTPVKKNENGQFLNEVMDNYANDAEYKMRLHTLHVLTKGFTDFSKFKSTEKSQAVKDLEKKLESMTAGGLGSGKTNTGLENGMTSRSIAKALPTFNKR